MVTYAIIIGQFSFFQVLPLFIEVCVIYVEVNWRNTTIQFSLNLLPKHLQDKILFCFDVWDKKITVVV